MAGGQKTVVINTQERAVSVDINRMQSFADAAIAERLRYARNVGQGTDDLDASGLNVETTTLTSPLSAEVEAGLEVQPQIASLSVFVTAGVLHAIAPDGSETPVGSPAVGDSSVYKYVGDTGTTSLTMTANSSGQTRVDVVECSVTQVISETDNRDIFNPSTGLFAAVSVSKAVQAALTYRVRTGTAGGGFPGFASGWLPLAVASVPTGTTTNDQITFWDVRPLIEDRIFAPSNLGRDFSAVEKVHALIDTASFSGRAVLEGLVEANASDQISSPAVAGLYRLGGRLRTGAPVADLVNVGGGLPDGLDLNAAANQSGTWSAGTPVYIYLLEPFGLPRWARYADATTGVRKPRSPRGIPVASPVAPRSFWGCPSSGIALPTATGLGGSTSKGVCVIATVGGAGQTVGALVADGRMQQSPTGFASSLAGTTTGTTNTYFALLEGTHYPANAKSLIVCFGCALGGSSGCSVLLNPQVQVVSGSGGNVYWQTPAGSVSPYAQEITGTFAPAFGMTLRIPVMPKYPADITGSTQLNIVWNAAVYSGSWAVGATGIQVIGWEF